MRGQGQTSVPRVLLEGSHIGSTFEDIAELPANTYTIVDGIFGYCYQSGPVVVEPVIAMLINGVGIFYQNVFTSSAEAISQEFSIDGWGPIIYGGGTVSVQNIGDACTCGYQLVGRIFPLFV